MLSSKPRVGRGGPGTPAPDIERKEAGIMAFSGSVPLFFLCLPAPLLHLSLSLSIQPVFLFVSLSPS